jgi:catechol 2,3-dioxygenase-like lactoylglutathione lyase family enzyme
MRARDPAAFEKTAPEAADSVGVHSGRHEEDDMLRRLSNAQVWVHDQDEALAFYRDKLGMEVREDVTVPELGNFRWLTVGIPGQEDVAITLMAVPGPPVFDEDTRRQILDLMAKGGYGGLFFSTDDCRGTYDELRGRGVEFQQEPVEQPYGIDVGLRDPSGNHMRIVQRTDTSA